MTALSELLGALRFAGYPVYPFGTESRGNSIVYTFVPVSSDKIKEQHRLEITVIAKTMKKGLEIMDAVKEALLTLGDSPLTPTILGIALNGGGSLENLETNTFHFKAFFIVTSRYRKDG